MGKMSCSKEAYAGHSWKVIPADGGISIGRMIVVAIDNDGFQRMNEYSAWKYKESNIPGMQFGGKGLSTANLSWKWWNLLSTKNTGLLGRAYGAIGSLGGNITFLGLVPRSSDLGSFHPLTGYTKMPSIIVLNVKNHADLRIICRDWKADDTDKTLMARHQASYIVHLFVIITTSSNKGSISNHIAIRIQSGAIHHREAWAEHLPRMPSFWQKIGINRL